MGVINRVRAFEGKHKRRGIDLLIFSLEGAVSRRVDTICLRLRPPEVGFQANC